MNNYAEVGRENTWFETTSRLCNLVAIGAPVMLIFILYREQNRAHDREEWTAAEEERREARGGREARPDEKYNVVLCSAFV